MITCTIPVINNITQPVLTECLTITQPYITPLSKIALDTASAALPLIGNGLSYGASAVGNGFVTAMPIVGNLLYEGADALVSVAGTVASNLPSFIAIRSTFAILIASYMGLEIAAGRCRITW